MDLEGLKAFYGVETIEEVVDAMERHIERLIARLANAEHHPPARTHVREG